jgi:hypothetical protein
MRTEPRYVEILSRVEEEEEARRIVEEKKAREEEEAGDKGLRDMEKAFEEVT